MPTGKPGDDDFTPPFDAPPLGPVALFPGWGRLTPSGIDLARHRLKGPDPLRSSRYARDLNIVKEDTEADPEWLPLLWTPPGMPPAFVIPPIPTIRQQQRSLRRPQPKC